MVSLLTRPTDWRAAGARDLPGKTEPTSAGAVIMLIFLDVAMMRLFDKPSEVFETTSELYLMVLTISKRSVTAS